MTEQITTFSNEVTLDEIFSKRDVIEQYCIKNDITYFGIFGSIGRKEQRHTNDIDILIKFTEPTSKGLIEFVSIEDELAEMFHKKVDLVTSKGLHPFLKNQILYEVVTVYERTS